MQTFDIAIVGTGGIAGIHAQSWSALGSRVRLVGAVDVHPDRLQAFGQRWGVPRLFGTLDELLDESGIDIVDVCTPPGLHAEQAIACLQRGVTVVCEKPPALSLAELDRIATYTGPAYFVTISQHRFGSGALALAGLVADGGLGVPTIAVCDTLWYRPDDYFDAPWRGRWDTEGGGPTMGHGIHQMDTLLSVLGPWREVVAIAARQAKPTATEDLSCALLTLRSGAIATIVNSLVSPRETSYLRFDFTDATVELSHLYGYGDEDWTVTPVPGQEERVRALWTSRLTGVRSGHVAQFTHILDALEAGTPPPVSLGQIRQTMELVAAIYASAATRRPVRQGELGPDSPFYTSHELALGGVPTPRVSTA